MLSMSSPLPPLRQEAPTNPAPPPANKLGAMPTGNPYMAPKKKPQNALLGSALDGFMRGFAPQQREADMERRKLEGQEKAKQTLALMQQQRALPVEQRAAWWQQNADTIGQIIGQDVRSMPIQPEQFADQALDGHIAALSAQMGIGPEKPPGPDYQFFHGQDGFVGRGDKTSGGFDVLQPGTPKPPERPDLPEGMMYGDDGQVVEVPGYSDMRIRIARGSQNPGSNTTDSYRPATPEEKVAYGVDPSVALTINTRTGKPDVLVNPKTTQLYSPTEEKNFRGKASALGTLKFLTDQYRSLVNQHGPGLWDGSMQGFEWKKTEEGQKLLAAHNNLMMFLKGPELFNLGVLTGPDVERLQRTLPEPVGMAAFGQDKKTLGIGLDSLDQLVGYQMGMIPEEFRPPPKPTDPSSSWIGKQAQRLMKMGGAPAPASLSQLAPGTIDVDDDTGQRYRFKGGDDTDPNNWEPVQ